MVGYSDVNFRGAGFQAHDVELAVWMHYVVAAIDRSGDRPGWLDDLRANWSDQATGGFGFGIVPGLDDFVTEGRRALMSAFFRQALAEMERHGDTLTVGELDSLKAGGPDAVFSEDLPMERFRNVARLAIDLLEGRS